MPWNFILGIHIMRIRIILIFYASHLNGIWNDIVIRIEWSLWTLETKVPINHLFFFLFIFFVSSFFLFFFILFAVGFFPKMCSSFLYSNISNFAGGLLHKWQQFDKNPQDTYYLRSQNIKEGKTIKWLTGKLHFFKQFRSSFLACEIWKMALSNRLFWIPSDHRFHQDRRDWGEGMSALELLWYYNPESYITS